MDIIENLWGDEFAIPDEKEKTKKIKINNQKIRLNNELDNYFTLTGTKNKSAMVYSISSNQKTHDKSIYTKTNVVPAISLDKELLTKGNGTIHNPYEME